MNTNFTTEKTDSQMPVGKFFPQIKIEKFFLATALIGVFFWTILFLFSCRSNPADLRKLMPAETLIYLETDDLGKIMQSLTNNQTFAQSAQKIMDFSALDGLQLAVAVTGFEVSENQVTDENSIINLKPQFVVVAETHSWNRYAVRFAEENLGEFVNETYGGEVTLEISDKADGTYFVWTAEDGRKAFAFVKESRIFFSNDEKVLEKCLAILRGESDSFANSGKIFEKSENTLAVGYVSSDGIAQISNLIGVSTALNATGDEEGRGFIARVVPQIIRNSVREITWTATKTEHGIEDKYQIFLTPEIAAALKETLIPSGQLPSGNRIFLTPDEVFTITRYNLKNPQIAWRSLVMTTGKSLGSIDQELSSAIADAVLTPYQIADAEAFLSAVQGEIWTVNFDAEGEESAVVATCGSDQDLEKIKKSVEAIDFGNSPKIVSGGTLWTSKDNATAFLTSESSERKLFILGSLKGVEKSIRAISKPSLNYSADTFYRNFAENNSAVSITFGRDSANRLIEALGERKMSTGEIRITYTTETIFTEKGLERKTVSPFGLIGRIIEQLEN